MSSFWLATSPQPPRTRVIKKNKKKEKKEQSKEKKENKKEENKDFYKV